MIYLDIQRISLFFLLKKKKENLILIGRTVINDDPFYWSFLEMVLPSIQKVSIKLQIREVSLFDRSMSDGR